MPDPNIPPPPQTSSLVIPAHPLIGREENMKNVFDKFTLELFGDADLRDVARSRARLDLRSERNAVAFDKAMDTVVALGFQNIVISTQTGDTTDQTASGPEHTAEGAEDTGNAAVGTSNAAVAANVAQLMSAMVPIIAASTGGITISPANLLSATLAAVVAAAGTASGNSAAPNNPAAASK